MSNQKKIRDLQRLLKSKVALNEEAKQGILKRIDDLQESKQVSHIQELKRKHASRYGMVKFFEKKKVLRMIRSAEKADEQAVRMMLMEDLAYIL